MDKLHKQAIPALFLTAAGIHGLRGINLLYNGLPTDLGERLSKIHGGNTKQNEYALSLLRGTQLELQGKGVILLGMSSLLLCALGSKDHTFVRTLCAFLAVGDMAILALYLRDQYSNTNKTLPLPSEQRYSKAFLTYTFLEGTALGVYAAVCTKH